MTKRNTIQAVAATACAGLAAIAMTTTKAVAQSGHASNSAAMAQLRAGLLRSGELADFTRDSCPMLIARRGSENGLREELRSARLGGLAFDSAIRFTSAHAAQAAVSHAAAQIREQGAVASLNVTGIPGAYGYRVAAGSDSEYDVVFFAGQVEHSIDVTLPHPASAAFIGRLVRAARLVYLRA
jgi:hypothetical protein